MSKQAIFQLIMKNKSKVRAFGVRKIGLFGSYVRGTQHKKSDIDFLVEFNTKSFDNYMDLKFFLEKQLKSGIDLVLADALKPSLKPAILKEVEYVQGI